MKISIKKSTTAIAIPDNFATLESSSADGTFRYRIRFTADPQELATLRAYKVRLHISKKPYVKKINPLFAGLVPQTLADRLRSAAGLQRDLTRAANSEYIQTFVIDLTTRIPNTKASKLSSGALDLIKKAKIVVTRPVSELRAENVNAPVLDANLGSRTTSPSEQQIKINALDSLFLRGVEPAQYSNARTNTIRTSSKAIAGTTTKTKTSSADGFYNDSHASSIFNSVTALDSQALDDTEYLGVLQEVRQKFIDIIEDIDVTEAATDDGEFYAILELVNDRGFPIQTTSNLIPHSQNLRILRVPTKPPKVTSIPVHRAGKVVFEVSQMDPNAKGISIYKRTISPNQNSLSSEYFFVGKTDLSFGQPTQRVEDLEGGLNHVSYRFIPYYDEFSVSSVFSSTVVKFARESMAKRASFLQRQNFVSITADVKSFGISLALKDLPYNATSVTLKKRNLSIGQKEYQIVGKSPMLFDIKGNGSLFVDDTEVSSGRTYEYSAFITYRDGATVAGSNTLVVEYEPVASNLVTAVISEPQLISLTNGYDVAFGIQLNPVNSSAELIKKLISEQGLQSEFQTDITSNKDKLTKLFAITVTRDNLLTGEVENFGVIDSLVFSDRKYGIAKNVKPVDPGAEYKYTVNVFLRNPETLFPGLTRTVQTRNTSYELEPSKWLHPVTLRDGNLVSDASLKRNHAKNAFTIGTIADIQTVNVSLANIMPEVSDAQVSRVRSNANLVRWKINGSASKIDHFIIVLEILGIRTIVGAAHSITNANYFEFVDTLDNGEKGALTYIIVPVYYDYSKGAEVKTNYVVV